MVHVREEICTTAPRGRVSCAVTIEVILKEGAG